jgi:hypothetical protein
VFVFVALETNLIFLQPKTTWRGIVTQTFPFEFHISQVKREKNAKQFEGFVLWPTLQQTKTKMRGKVFDTNQFEYEEYDISEGDAVEVPVTYRGTLIQTATTTTTTATTTATTTTTTMRKGEREQNEIESQHLIGVGTFEGNDETLKGKFEIDFKPRHNNDNK